MLPTLTRYYTIEGITREDDREQEVVLSMIISSTQTGRLTLHVMLFAIDHSIMKTLNPDPNLPDA